MVFLGAAAPWAGRFFGVGVIACGDKQPRHGRSVLQRGAHDLGRVDDALLHQIAVFAGRGVVAEGIVVLVHDLADDHGAVFAGILGDLSGRRVERAADDIDADPLVVIGGLQFGECGLRADQGYAAAGQNAFLDRGPRRIQRIVDAVLLFLDLHLGAP